MIGKSLYTFQELKDQALGIHRIWADMMDPGQCDTPQTLAGVQNPSKVLSHMAFARRVERCFGYWIESIEQSKSQYDSLRKRSKRYILGEEPTGESQPVEVVEKSAFLRRD